MNDKPFTTARIREWRKAELKETFLQTLQRIETYGCEVWSISSDYVSPSFSYTVGNFDVCGGPELITVGLASNVAHHSLDEASKLIRAGVDLTEGRHRELVGKVDIEFRPVDPAWMHHIMLRTNWYYRGENVPVLQLIYPDLENRFPEDEGFDRTFAQPFLAGLPDNTESVAHDLWLAHDRESGLSRWKFPCSPHTSAYLSETVNNGQEPIVYVSHDRDGDWQFLGDAMSDGGGPVLVCLHHPVDGDRSLEELHDLPQGWYAERAAPGEPWTRGTQPAEDDDEQPDPAISSLN